jgi:putative restriction endonuclease
MALNQMEQDLLREQIFAKVREMTTQFGGALTYNQLINFEIDGERVALVGQRGIINPRIFDATLTVTSAAEGPYDDHFDEDGILKYKFEAGDPRAGSNRKLLVAMETRTPIILFERPISNLYVPYVGAFIIGADFENLNVSIAADSTIKAQVEAGMTEVERRYATVEVRRRVHQPLFRARVLSAYDRRCAICRLNHADLLDAAHIIPDADEGGSASVPNGLSLCKIHHAAYDRNLLGISPDYKVHIDAALLEENDGPMLQHGLKAMHLTEITTPNVRANKPDKDKLAQRFELFLAS